MSTLTEFLLARITEDEEIARAGISGQADPENGWGFIETGVSRGALTPHVGIIHEPVQAAHITRWHPARVLAECESKRRIVSLFATTLADEMQATAGVWNETAWRGEQAIRALTLPYADHPSFQEEWRV